jgi:hypothetical protein
MIFNSKYSVLHCVFVEDTIFTYEVCLSLKYITAMTQAGLKFMVVHFETIIIALLSGQDCNILHSREKLHF